MSLAETQRVNECRDLVLYQEPRGWFTWIPTSMKALVEAERRIFRGVRAAVVGRSVRVRQEASEVWTVSVDKTEDKTPLVLVHGFAGGVGLWAQNLDALSQHRSVHAFDLLGFARSSRPRFSRDATLVETEWVQSIEDWRREMKLDKMILLGHSLGGFLASSYAIEHPEHVRHLILVDPWGFPRKPLDSDRQMQLPTWVRAVARVMSVFNPLSSLRAAGPYGRAMVKRFRPDLGRRFAALHPDDPEGTTPDEEAVYDYIYHCNAQSPSGESAFKSLSESFGWAKRPMMERLPKQLLESVPVSFLYGSRSWIDSGPGFYIENLRPRSYVQVEMVEGAGHHVYADQAELFNAKVEEICNRVDEGYDLSHSPLHSPHNHVS